MTPEGFARALDSLDELDMPAEASEQRLAIAGLGVRVRVATPRLAEICLRAFAHRASGEAGAPPVDLTISVFTLDSPGNPLRELPPRHRSSRPAGDRIERWSYEGALGRGLLHEGFRALYLWNRERRTAALWLGDAGDVPYHMVATPLVPILSWFLGERGLPVIHAAAVATERGGVLLAGRSGTGKSTAALACLRDGLGFLGDDLCLVEAGSPPIVHSLFCSAKLVVSDAARFPALSPARVRPPSSGWEKAVYLFDRERRTAVVRRAPLLGVAIPVRGAAAVAPALTARQGFLAMAPNTVFQLPGAARAACAGVKEVVSRLPVHPVGVGTSIDDIAGRIRDFAGTLAPSGDRGAFRA